MTQQQVVVSGAEAPLWMRSVRDGRLHAEVVDASFAIDRSRDAHVHLIDAASRTAEVPAEGAAVEVDLVYRRVLQPRRDETHVDRKLNFRDLTRQLAQRDYGGPCDIIELEHWHLQPSAAELFAVTPADRLPWSYARRFANAFDAVRGCSGSSDYFQLALATWAEEWFSDDAQMAALLKWSELPLARLMEALGPVRAEAGVRDGLEVVRKSREMQTIYIRGIETQWETVKANATTLAEGLSARGVVWAHSEARDVPPPMDLQTMQPTGDSNYSLVEWLSPEVNMTALYDRAAGDAFLHIDSPIDLQLAVLRYHAARVVRRNIQPTAERPPLEPGEADGVTTHVMRMIRAERYAETLRREVSST